MASFERLTAGTLDKGVPANDREETEVNTGLTVLSPLPSMWELPFAARPLGRAAYKGN